MDIFSDLLVAAVALLHLYFLYLEMFLWTKPAGLRIFRNTPERAEMTKVLAANQGLYNGFLAAGLIWALTMSSHVFEFDIKLFFLSCIILAALLGAVTVSRRIFYVQGLPAILALVITVGFDNPYLEMKNCCGKPQTAQSMMKQVR